MTFGQKLRKLREAKGISQQQLAEKSASLTQTQELLNQKTSAMADLHLKLEKLRLSSLGSESELSNLKALVSSKDAALKDKDAQITVKDSELQEKNSQIDSLMKQLEALKKGGVSGLGGAGGLFPR